MYDYFHKTPLDEAFFEEHLAGRLPARILDAHGHFERPIQKLRIADDAEALFQ